MIGGQGAVVRRREKKLSIKNYQELQVWQKAMAFVESVYRATQAFPREEQFGLTNQVRRAVVSIPSNIAEGQGRNSTQAFLHFLSIAYGSLQESETQIMLAHRLGYMNPTDQDALLSAASEIARMINGLQKSLAVRQSGD
ncbi:four helix bundle protein [Thiomonas sp.]